MTSLNKSRTLTTAFRIMKFLTISRTTVYVFLLLIFRKIIIAFIAMNTVMLNADEVSYERMISDTSFVSIIKSLPSGQETYVLILNKHALNMTMNWLCNTHSMKDVHNNSLIVTLDEYSATTLRNQWPEVRQLKWIVHSLKDSFNYGDGYYQLFYVFRANFVRAMIRFNRTFWMIQQDTFWADSLSSINFSTREEDIIFDRGSDKGPLIAGGYFRVRPTANSKAYFDKLSKDISWWYVPDNAYMTSMCELSGLASCGGLPFRLITNWQWCDSIHLDVPPTFIQFDGEAQLGGKLAKMKRLGFYFLNEDGKTCQVTAMENAQKSLNSAVSKTKEVASYSHQQFKFYQNVVDLMYGSKFTSWIVNRWILPYAHFCMLSL